MATAQGLNQQLVTLCLRVFFHLDHVGFRLSEDLDPLGVKTRNLLLDGRDIRSLLIPGSPGPGPGEFEFYYSHSKNNLIAVRKGPWKLLVATPSQTGSNHGFTATEETPILFNVEQDIGERINRATEQPELTQKLLSLLIAKRREME